MGQKMFIFMFYTHPYSEISLETNAAALNEEGSL